MGVSVGVGDGDTVGEGVGDAADAGEIVGTDSTVSGLSHATTAVASNSATKVEVATEVQQVLAGFLMAGPLSSAPRLTSLLLRLSPLPMVRLDAKPLHGIRVQLQVPGPDGRGRAPTSRPSGRGIRCTRRGLRRARRSCTPRPSGSVSIASAKGAGHLWLPLSSINELSTYPDRGLIPAARPCRAALNAAPYSTPPAVHLGEGTPIPTQACGPAPESYLWKRQDSRSLSKLRLRHTLHGSEAARVLWRTFV